jgi:pimeloyl-ACP methyl ester carboxylesterase
MLSAAPDHYWYDCSQSPPPKSRQESPSIALNMAASLKHFAKLVLGFLVIIAACVCVGAVYNTIILRSLRTAYPVPGDFYQVDGHTMHLYCIGTGSPTVVLESGLGDDWIYWQKVQPEVEKSTRVCSYDRAGLGWSAPQPTPRDAEAISSQLHTLLLTANEHGPFLLVGASAGGFYVRQYFSSFPADVAGVVFVDSSVPEQLTVFPDRMDTEAKRHRRHREATLQWLKEFSGYARVSGHCKGEVEKGMQSYSVFVAAESCRPNFTTAWLPEYDDFWRSAEEASRTRCCGDVPLLVISQDPDRPKVGWDAQSIAQQPTWSSLQENLKRLSAHSRRIIAKSSGHHVMADRPDVVITGIQNMVLLLRNNVADSEEGTTRVQ